MPDVTTLVIPALLRWIHVLFGIIWIGHLYFFNFVNVNFEKGLDASLKKPVIPQLRPRALWWFRWGAMITMLSGVVYVVWEQFVASNLQFSGWFDNAKDIWITFGALLGLIMWFNVWFVIWPNQKVILAGISTGNKPADFDARVATAGKFSRINTYLSVPMLFGMIARSHYPSSVDKWLWITMAFVFVVGLAIAYHFIWMVGPKVGKEFIAAAPAAPPPPPK
jgi:uncharacterized membrane protein